MKIFRSHRADEQIQREIAFLRKITHQHVMRVFWADRTVDGKWYLVSEYIEGVPLDRTIAADVPLDQDKAIQIVDELLEALIAIHPNDVRIAELKAGELSPRQFAELQELQNAGFVHRDVKPGNIILGDSGIKLLDFNIASSAGDPVQTRSGTPEYQPPDVVPVWDVSTDLFAAGVILYELLTGQHPYIDREPRADREPRDPREFRSNMSSVLADLAVKACANTAVRRFSSARDMKIALLAAQHTDDVDMRSQELGARLHWLREDSEMTIHELAQLAGLEDWILAEIESGERPAMVDQIEDLARALEIPVVRLLGTEPE